VLIVGFGRVGRLVGENADRTRTELRRRRRRRHHRRQGAAPRAPNVFYGDAGRPTCWPRCGIEKARAMVVTMDAPAKVDEVVIAGPLVEARHDFDRPGARFPTRRTACIDSASPTPCRRPPRPVFSWPKTPWSTSACPWVWSWPRSTNGATVSANYSRTPCLTERPRGAPAPCDRRSNDRLRRTSNVGPLTQQLTLLLICTPQFGHRCVMSAAVRRALRSGLRRFPERPNPCRYGAVFLPVVLPAA
jgi:hypothetical protein